MSSENEAAGDFCVADMSINERLMFVDLALHIGGCRAAIRAWHLVDLPDVFNSDEACATRVPPAAVSDVHAWLAVRTVPAEGRTAAMELYTDYVSWCTGEGVEPSSMTAFGRVLSARGFGKMKSIGGRVERIGLALVKPNN